MCNIPISIFVLDIVPWITFFTKLPLKYKFSVYHVKILFHLPWLTTALDIQILYLDLIKIYNRILIVNYFDSSRKKLVVLNLWAGVCVYIYVCVCVCVCLYKCMRGQMTAYVSVSVIIFGLWHIFSHIILML